MRTARDLKAWGQRYLARRVYERLLKAPTEILGNALLVTYGVDIKSSERTVQLVARDVVAEHLGDVRAAAKPAHHLRLLLLALGSTLPAYTAIARFSPTTVDLQHVLNRRRGDGWVSCYLLARIGAFGRPLSEAGAAMRARSERAAEQQAIRRRRPKRPPTCSAGPAGRGSRSGRPPLHRRS